jgi:aromatic ring-opening dioxygenase catalytic subunit (LigB family)
MDANPGDSFYHVSKGSDAMKSLQSLPKQLGAEKPKAIVIITAHWERYIFTPFFSPKLHQGRCIFTLHTLFYPPYI